MRQPYTQTRIRIETVQDLSAGPSPFGSIRDDDGSGEVLFSPAERPMPRGRRQPQETRRNG